MKTLIPTIRPRDFFSLPTRSLLFDDDFFNNPSSLFPKVDLKETEKELILSADIPGYSKDEIKLNIVNNYICISANKEDSHENKEDNYHIKERSFASFSRNIRLPKSVNPKSIKADLKEGSLTVKMQKQASELSQEIKIN